MNNKILCLTTKTSFPSIKNLIKEISLITESNIDTSHDTKTSPSDIQEVMDMNESNRLIFIEHTKRMDKLWIGSVDGASIKFKILDFITMSALNSTFNIAKNRFLVFYHNFEEIKEIKNIMEQIFVPSEEADNVISFFYKEKKIFFRNYKIDGDELREIGPRMTLEVEKVYENFMKN
ncbi:Brix domain-containing protein [Spraguea lophii 42_110]|uniref:Brix domain-containing protein n=1 Tax=Spraguea lophii (strain 42_110) TaxID=1358809 RepID=S7WA46_SPRLO|nr:Brix domain-containing protein [Spraguea lophii 42_110]